MATVEALVSLQSRAVGQPGNARAAAYLYRRLSAISGLSVEYQDATHSNVVATLRGTEPGRPLYIVGAHYDSTSSDLAQAPGATDNAAGVAIVLELARVMSRHEYRHTIQFACWNGEETGLLGSKAFVEELAERGTPIGLYFNYDSTAYDPANRLVLDLMHDAKTLVIRDLMVTNNTLYDIGFTLTENRHKCGGDHVPFRNRGFPAMTTHQEGHGAHYHTPDDTADKVSVIYARKNAQLGLTVLATLALKHEPSNRREQGHE